MFESILKFLSGGAGEQVAEYFSERRRLRHEIKLKNLEGIARVQEAEVAAKVARLQMQANQQAHEQSWEMAHIANSGKKDEVVLAVVLAPYVGSFIPVVQDYVVVGFQYLAQMPLWAVGLTVTICLAIYGIRHRNATKINAPGLRDKDVATGE